MFSKCFIFCLEIVLTFFQEPTLTVYIKMPCGVYNLFVQLVASFKKYIHMKLFPKTNLKSNTGGTNVLDFDKIKATRLIKTWPAAF